MPPCQRIAAICWSMLVFTMACGSYALQGAPAPQSDATPSRKSLDYAAAAAFAKLMESRSYTLPADKVRDVVLGVLRNDSSQPPKHLPAAEQLQNQLDPNFDDAWTEMINQATAGLDPDGSLEVAKRLRASLVENPQWRNKAKAEHDDLLKNELPKALERLKGALVEEQKKQLIETLKSVVSTDLPGQEHVNGAALSGDQAPATKVLTDEVLGKLPKELLEIVIVESFEALSEAANNVVADGVAQLEQQLESLEKSPAAVSRPAIEKEIQNRLQKLADGQQASRAGDSLRPSYGIFARAQQEIPDKSQHWFDQQVARCGGLILEELALNKRHIPREDEQTLRQLILSDPARHHQLAESWQSVQPAIQEMVDRGQQWIVEELLKACRQSSSPEDREYPEERFRHDITEIVTAPDTRGHASWSRLQKVLLERYKTDVLKTVRDTIAAEQTRQYASLLADQKWTPTEDLLQIPLPLADATLKQLPFWNSRPPLPENIVLREAWDVWLKSAQAALEVTHQAHDGQLQIVDSLEEGIRQEILKDPEPSLDKWVKQYSLRTTQLWREQGTTVAAKYPQLFSTTVDRIDQIVAKILPLVAQGRSEILLDEPEMKPEPQPQESPDNNVPPQPTPEQPVPPAPQPEEPDSDPALDGPGSPDEMGDSDKSYEKGGPHKSGDGEADDADDRNNDEPGGEEEDGNEGQDEGEDDAAGDGDGEKNGSADDGEAAESRDARRIPLDLSRRTLADWFFRIAFWVLLMLLLVMAVCWYLQVRYYKRLLAQYRRTLPLDKW